MTEEFDTEKTIREAPFDKALSERYLSYALSTIMSRSLPDVRDGLKPVHRRLLYAMRQLKLDPSGGFKKSARVVGDVIGKYHPHGDQAIYDAMVRLAQDFAVRYPLVDGQGNFGNIDGDNAAAMRYTEARLTDVALALLEHIDEDTVDFRPTYDGEELEPAVLPGGFPNLLANGATGIAVGMATSIPPHNIAEICEALLALNKNSRLAVKDLVKHIRGPDFPTGGVIVEPADSILAAYENGRGGFRLRARWEKEDLGRGQYQIVVTEIPYSVQKSRLIEKIAELIQSKKLPQLDDIHDESAEDVRLVLMPKSRTIPPDVLMESLFKLTDLETRIPLNMNVLDGGTVPRVMSLKEVLQAFLDHQIEVLQRRSEYRLSRIAHRLEVLDGFLIAFLNLDEVIRIIRFEDEPKKTLAKTFKLSDVQVDAILNMRLRALHKLEEIAIREEHDSLTSEQGELKALLKSKQRQKTAVGKQITAVAQAFGPDTALGARRSDFGAAPKTDIVTFDEMIEKEPVTVVCSEMGWIRTLKGHVEDKGDTKYKEGDKGRFWLHAQTTDKLLLFGTNGRFYTLDVAKLPGGRGHGEPVRLMIDLGKDEEIVDLRVYDPETKYLVASSDGRGFIVKAETVMAETRKGKQVLNVKGDVEAAVCTPAEGDHVAVIGENRKLLIYPRDEVPEMTRGKGVILQRYKDGGLSDAQVFTLAEGLQWALGDKTRTETDIRDWIGKRAQAGRLPPKGFPRSNRFG